MEPIAFALRGALVLAGMVCTIAPCRAGPTSAPSTAPAYRPVAVTRADVDPFFQRLADDGWCAGVAVGVLDDGGPRVFGYGRASDGANRPPDGDTVYEIGSVSKVFTSLLLAEMVRDGRVALDDPVQQYLPDGATVPRREGAGPITLAHLATHTSGLPRMPSNFHPADPANPYADYTPGQMYAFLAGCKPARDPGGAYEYSNLGVSLLGQVLARRAGVGYEALLDQQICQPLRMPNTRITLTGEMRRRLAPGHDADGNPAANWDIPTFAGAGAIRSTARDLLTFVAAQVGRAERLDPALTAAIALTHERRATVGPGTDIALGWHIDTAHHTLWHNGQTGGYHSFVGFSPERRVGVVALTNTAGGVIDAAAARLLRRLMGDAIDPPTLPPTVRIDPRTLDRYAGTYLLGLRGVLTVSRDGDRLFAQVFGQPPFRIYAESDDTFYWRVVDARMTFRPATDGAVDRFTFRQNGTELTGRRLPAGANGRPATTAPAP